MSHVSLKDKFVRLFRNITQVYHGKLGVRHPAIRLHLLTRIIKLRMTPRSRIGKGQAFDDIILAVMECAPRVGGKKLSTKAYTCIPDCGAQTTASPPQHLYRQTYRGAWDMRRKLPLGTGQSACRLLHTVNSIFLCHLQ